MNCLKCGKEIIGRTKKCQECKNKGKKSKEKKCISCENIVTGKTKKCQECKDKEYLESRTKVCPRCEKKFILEDHQHGRESICQECKENDYKFIFFRIKDFVDNTYKFFPNISLEKKVHVFALKSRNDVQAVTDYREFKKYDIKFTSVKSSDRTFDHVNAMTFIIENYILEVLKDDRKLLFLYFKEYLLKYGVQFRVTQKHNIELIKYQIKGITPEEYISVVGLIKGYTEKESIEKIREYFING